MTEPLHDDHLHIIDDHETVASPALPPWQVLVVDDDPEVHNATLFALQDIEIDGRGLHFIQAHSGAEALAAVRDNDDIAVVLLDVVMENESAGLDVVRAIRQDFERKAMRIILRTGQPGYAPEMRVIRDFDINDYKTKSELTRVRLLTTLTTAVRSYDQLRTIMASRRGLALMVDSAGTLFAHRDLAGFSRAAAAQASALAGEDASAFLCTCNAGPGLHATLAPRVVAGACGAFAALTGRSLREASMAGELAERAFAARETLIEGQTAAFFIPGDTGREAVLCLQLARALPESTRQLLQVFCINIGTGLANVSLISHLSFSAYTDTLTRLANRSGFVTRIDEHLRQNIAGWTVALVDIDHFSELNDALGHQKGDQLLLAVAQRLTMQVGDSATLARVGGDVFGLLAPEATLDPRKLIELFRAPFSVGEYSLPVQATLGLTRLDDVQKQDGIDILKATNIALNRAKSGDRGRWHYYTEQMAAETRGRLDLLHELRLAIAHQRGLELHYQPQLELISGRLVGAEALIRWRGADGNFIRPDLFISLAEYSGLIVDLGAWVFHTAVRQLREWERCGLDGVRMAINVSQVQFRDPQFLQRIHGALADTGISPARIELEITESVAMMEEETVIAILTELKTMGFQIAIDDFGTGFSSLSYLHRLPIDRMKIDRAFVRDLDSPLRPGASIAETIIRLGQSLGLSIIAEGIETETQAQLLMNLGCPLAQGFLYSRPIDAAAFVAWAKAR